MNPKTTQGPTPIDSLDDASYQSTTTVQFRDTDAMGIVNHAVLISYLENTRTEFLFDVLAIDDTDDINFLIAHVDCDYRSPVRYGDRVRAGVRVTSIGNKSFTMAYRLEQHDSGRLVAEAETVQVFFDYDKQASMPVPEGFRSAVAAYDETTTGSDV